MSFTTKKPKKQYNMTKFKFSCDDRDPDLSQANLPATYNHMWVITAKPRQGKSTYLMNLIAKQNRASPYNKKFDKVFIFSPSMKTIDDDPFESIPEEQKFAEMNTENLGQVLNEVEGSGDRVLIIADDVVNDIKGDKEVERMITKMMMNRRHICGKNEDGDSAGISMWITTQIFNRLPRPLRASASHYTIFKTTNKKELDTIYDELILLDKPDFKKLLDFVFDEKYNSLYVNTDNEFDKMYHKNFDLIVLNNKGESNSQFNNLS